MLFQDISYIDPLLFVFVDKRVMLIYAAEDNLWLASSQRTVCEIFYLSALPA